MSLSKLIESIPLGQIAALDDWTPPGSLAWMLAARKAAADAILERAEWRPAPAARAPGWRTARVRS